MKRYLVIFMVVLGLVLVTGLAAAAPPSKKAMAGQATTAPCAKFRGYNREACDTVVQLVRAFFADRYPEICRMATDRFLLTRFGGLEKCLRTPAEPGEAAPTIKVVRVIASQEEASVWIRGKKELGLWCLRRVGASFKVDDAMPSGSAWTNILAIRRYC